MPHREWFPLFVQPDTEPDSLRGLLVVCANVLELRLSDGPSGKLWLEVLCGEGAELERAEALVRQARTDEALRRRIAEQCDQSVNLLAAGIIERAGGG